MMTRGVELFFSLFNNLAIFIALVTLYNYLIHKYHKLYWVKRQLLAGFSFGLFAIGCMYAKIPVFEGVIVDQRNAIIVLSGAFGGPVSAIISASMAGMFRLHLGGSGAFAGIVGVTLSAFAGTILYRYKDKFKSTAQTFIGSLFATLVILPGFLFVNDLQTGWGLLKAMALPYGTAIFCGIFLISLMLRKQEEGFAIEQSFRKNQERLNLALTGANDGHWDLDLKNGSVYFSPRYKEILGYTDGELPNVEESWTNNVYPKDLEPARTALKPLIDGEQDHIEFEYRMQHKDGSLRWIHSRGTCVKDNSGRVYRLAGTHTDITERKQVEESLLLAHSIIDKANIGIYVISPEGLIKEVNQKAAELLGFTKEDLKGLFIADLDPGVAQETWQPHIENLNMRKSRVHEREHRKKDGTIIPVEIHGYLLEHQDQQHVIAFVQDISERKKIEKEREKLIKELLEALENVKILSGLLPICSQCKKIRDDQGYWNNLEAYIEKHSGASFSHGMCEECSDRLYGDEDWYIKMKKNKGNK